MAFPPLTLLEEFLLLALDDAAGEFYDLPCSVLDSAMAGAVLMDLALHNRVDHDLKTLFVTDPTPTGDALLDIVLVPMATSLITLPETIATWVHRIAEDGPAIRELALRRLEARSLIVREEKKILKIFTSSHFRVENTVPVLATRARILKLILQDDFPVARDCMLIALANACGLFGSMLSGKEFANMGERIALLSRMDLVGQAVAQAVREVEAVIRMAARPSG